MLDISLLNIDGLCRDRNVTGAYFKIVDQNIGVVDRSWHIVRSPHVSINDELEMMGPGGKLNHSREAVAARADRVEVDQLAFPETQR